MKMYMDKINSLPNSSRIYKKKQDEIYVRYLDKGDSRIS